MKITGHIGYKVSFAFTIYAFLVFMLIFIYSDKSFINNTSYKPTYHIIINILLSSVAYNITHT